MAARTRKLTLSDAWKDKIRVSMIAGRLYDHLQGTVEMSNTQVKAAQILLGKLVPDLARTEVTGDPNNPIKTSLEVTFK